MTTSAFTRGPASVPASVAELPPAARGAFTDRLAVLTSALGAPAPLALAEAVEFVADEVRHANDLLWLSHSVLAAELPSDEDMDDLLVRARLGGTWAALAPLLSALASETRFRDVEVVRGAVTCDVHTTVDAKYLSGIQRVVQATTRRWHESHEVEFVGWVGDDSALRRSRPVEVARLLGHVGDELAPSEGGAVVVPWESTHLWVEVIVERERTERLLALAQHSRNEVGVLGYDSIPITSSATVAQGMTSHFARGVAAMRRADRVAMISPSAEAELRGVMRMGAGRGDSPPDTAAVALPVEVPATSDEDLLEAREALTVEGVPMVLVIGSHEPRKNHLAVLHSAELLWREGVRFNLVLAGAQSWNASDYQKTLDALAAAGRPVQSIRGLPDRLLWAAYRLAHCTVFPSLNEGFGLPVAESIAAGTPVVTSRFGSMRDIVAPAGEPLGGLLVDPRDDADLTQALRTLLTDPVTWERLRRETADHPSRTWDDYANELWDFLVDGVRPVTTGRATTG